MKAEALAKELMMFPDFEVKFGILEPDGSSYGVGLRIFDVGVDDIGHSSKVLRLGPTMELKQKTSTAE